MKKKWKVIAYPYDISGGALKRSGFDSVEEAISYFNDYHSDDEYVEINFTSYDEKEEVNVETNT